MIWSEWLLVERLDLGVGEKASERRKEKEEALALGRWNSPGEQGSWERGGAGKLAGVKNLAASGRGRGEKGGDRGVGALGGVGKMGKGDGLGWKTKQERKLSDWVNFRGLEKVEAGRLRELVFWV